MKIYFTGSVSGAGEYSGNYKKIIDMLKKMGHVVFEQTTQVSKDYVHKEISDEDKVLYYRQVLSWMNKSDVIVVEASHSSLSIGHEITVALEKGKPVIVLYSVGDAPHFLVGVKSEKLIVEKYSNKNIEKVLGEAISHAADSVDTRFNFFISPKIANYLDWVAKKKRTPRAVYLRRLIENDIKSQKFEK